MDFLSQVYLYNADRAISHADILESHYAEAYAGWKRYFDKVESGGFGTSPVKGAYLMISRPKPKSGWVASMRDVQYKFNKVKSEFLKANYGDRHQMRHLDCQGPSSKNLLLECFLKKI